MKRNLAAAASFALALAVPLAGPAVAQTGLIVATSVGHADPSVLSLREMAVDVGIARGYARVNIRQVHENHTGAVQEGTWRFRLPESGAVGDFAVWDGLTRIPGVILEKRRARAIYQELTAQRIDPGLLQQGEEEDRAPGSSEKAGERPSGGAAFAVKIAPINAWSTKRLEVQYQQEVPWADGAGELRIPLRPTDGEPMTAGLLTVRITLEDGDFLETKDPKGAPLPLQRKGRSASFEARNVKLDRDAVVRFRPAAGTPLSLACFRNPDGTLPDGLALAPWERPSDVPPEKDGFFLLEVRPAPSKPGSAGAPAPKPRAAVSVVVLFDTSLSQRWGGLEAGYAVLVRLLGELGEKDRVTLVPFDAAPTVDGPPLALATEETKRRLLELLRSRPLAPGSDVAAAVARAAALLPGEKGRARIVLVTDAGAPAAALKAAAASVPLFVVATAEERPEGFAAAAAALLQVRGAAAAEPSAEETLFVAQLLAEERKPEARTAAAPGAPPFSVSGGDPKLRDVYGVLTQPPLPGSLSGWVGRYAQPVAKASVHFTGGPSPLSLASAFPEKALDARDLPRRWARARVDELLRRIELEGERREWVEEIIALSRRYKFVTPYTAFLAAPRSLLRPRRIQPGDPVLRVEADAGVVSVTALLPFGRRLPLARRGKTSLWEGRFLVPEGLPDGPMDVRLVLRDASGATVTETKRVVIDGTAPRIAPVPPKPAAAGQRIKVAARTDSDVVALSVRLDDGPPVPLRWDAAALASTGELTLPAAQDTAGTLFFEAIDGAGNHGFASATLEVR